jgi:hypothetical protein
MINKKHKYNVYNMNKFTRIKNGIKIKNIKKNITYKTMKNE